MSKRKKLEGHLEGFFKELGLDLEDPNLKQTAMRMAKMFEEELFSSLKKEADFKVTTFPNDREYDEMIMLDNIPFVSICSHHFVFFSGRAWLLYMPDKKLVGASKIARLIEFFSKKPQLQENLTQEVIDTFMRLVSPKGAMLVMRATHQCMANRGVRTGPFAGMTTSAVRGVFKDNPIIKSEALHLIKLSVEDRGGGL